MTRLADQRSDSATSEAPTNGNSDAGILRTGRRFILRGRVQGLGVRPAIFGLATDLRLAGQVRNTERGVVVEVEGLRPELAKFERRLPVALPVGTIVDQLDVESFDSTGCDRFSIVKESADGPLAARVPEDRAVCNDCLREISEPDDRRHRYSFTSCTQCGPRYTVIRAMPFEREETVMDDFPLCEECGREYRQPGDRRFHAQTTACATCGPRLDATGSASADSTAGPLAEPVAPEVAEAVRQLRAGQIVAVRGLGGYQLLVDATNPAAVARLRARKGRQAKPLAVMVESLAAAEQLAELDADEREAFADPAAPIVLVKAKQSSGLAREINGDFDTVGLMWPTTPLHAMLARESGRPLVCTSGNREGDPLEYEVAGAEERLADIADFHVHHDREITRPIDDSVVRVIAERRVTIRLARGLAPLALDLPAMPPTLAVGGFLKAAVAWSNGAQSVLGPHIGDQETLATRERFVAHLEDWQRLYRFRPALLVHDMHPEYFSTQWALQQTLPTLAVQHHHAHIVSGMLEHGWLDREVLGVAWDGTGYGTDGTIWGGEFLVSTAKSFQRVARLRPFRLPGGEAAIREPWRIAASMCQQLGATRELWRWPDWRLAPDQITSVLQIAQRPQLSPLTSSAGRLFDAAAALALGMTVADFDGQAAMRLEAIADPDAAGHYDLPLSGGELVELDWRPMFVQLLSDKRRGVPVGTISMRFHRGLARGIVAVCQGRPELPAVLSGGVFQNRLLTELVADFASRRFQPLGLPGIIPPNDGGLAAGQLAVAAAKGNHLPCA